MGNFTGVKVTQGIQGVNRMTEDRPQQRVSFACAKTKNVLVQWDNEVMHLFSVIKNYGPRISHSTKNGRKVHGLRQRLSIHHTIIRNVLSSVEDTQLTPEDCTRSSTSLYTWSDLFRCTQVTRITISFLVRQNSELYAITAVINAVTLLPINMS